MSIERREFLRRVATLGSGLAVGSLASYITRRFDLFGGALSIFEPDHLGSDYPEVIQYYPELRKFIVYDEGTIKLEKRTVRFFNFSYAKFFPDGAKSLYEYCYSVASTQAIGQLSYSVDGADEKFLLSTYENDRETLFIVLPGPLPRQLENTMGPDEYSRFSHISYGDQDNSITSIIMAHESIDSPFFAGSAETYLSVVSASRICDSVINVVPITVDLTNTERLARVSSVGRQAVSNSLGVAAWQRQEGESYQSYVSLSRGIKGVVPGQEYEFPLIIIPEQMYHSIPQGKILTV